LALAPHRWLLGDVVICPAVARSHAARQQPEPGETSPPPSFSHPALDDTSAEIALLVVHGTLHLCGHDHATAPERELMFERQQTYLTSYFNRQPELPASFTAAANPEP